MESSTAKNEGIPEDVTFSDITDQPLVQKLISNTIVFTDGFLHIQPYNQVFPKSIKDYLPQILDFDVRDDDVWISSFPKCGTTWTQEMVWCLLNDSSFEEAKAIKLDQRVPFFELSAILPTYTGENSITDIGKRASPRIIKTHLKFEMLPRQCIQKRVKLIYVTRNPRDVCVSYYNHWRLLHNYVGSLSDFIDLFLNGICGMYTPFLPHVQSYWDRRNSPNFLFIRYEEMKRDLPSVIKKVATFLGKEIDEENISKLELHLSFNNMKKNPAVNKEDFVSHRRKINKEKFGREILAEKLEFMRKGKVGDWKEHFTNDEVEKFEKWESDGLKDSDLCFSYE